MGNLFKLCFLLFALSASVFVSCTPEDGGGGSLDTVPLPSPSVTVQRHLSVRVLLPYFFYLFECKYKRIFKP